MIELAEIFRRHWPAYQTQFGERIPAAHRRAVQAILACGTLALGGHRFVCGDCRKEVFVYHSCNCRDSLIMSPSGLNKNVPIKGVNGIAGILMNGGITNESEGTETDGDIGGN